MGVHDDLHNYVALSLLRAEISIGSCDLEKDRVLFSYDLFGPLYSDLSSKCCFKAGKFASTQYFLWLVNYIKIPLHLLQTVDPSCAI